MRSAAIRRRQPSALVDRQRPALGELEIVSLLADVVGVSDDFDGSLGECLDAGHNPVDDFLVLRLDRILVEIEQDQGVFFLNPRPSFGRGAGWSG